MGPNQKPWNVTAYGLLPVGSLAVVDDGGGEDEDDDGEEDDEGVYVDPESYDGFPPRSPHPPRTPLPFICSKRMKGGIGDLSGRRALEVG